jgi:hypothetical protein
MIMFSIGDYTFYQNYGAQFQEVPMFSTKIMAVSILKEGEVHRRWEILVINQLISLKKREHFSANMNYI